MGWLKNLLSPGKTQAANGVIGLAAGTNVLGYAAFIDPVATTLMGAVTLAGAFGIQSQRAPLLKFQRDLEEEVRAALLELDEAKTPGFEDRMEKTLDALNTDLGNFLPTPEDVADAGGQPDALVSLLMDRLRSADPDWWHVPSRRQFAETVIRTAFGKAVENRDYVTSLTWRISAKALARKAHLPGGEEQAKTLLDRHRELLAAIRQVDAKVDDANAKLDRLLAEKENVDEPIRDVFRRLFRATDSRSKAAAAELFASPPNPQKARSILLQSAEEQEQGRTAADEKLAETYRQIAAIDTIDTIDNTVSAIDAWEKVVATAPQFWDWIELCRAHRRGGNLAKAQAAAEQAGRAAKTDRDQSVALNDKGDVLLAQGDGPAALDAHQESRTIAERLANTDPENTEWQRDLSVSHEKVGNVLLAQGDGPAALNAYKDSRTIREQLANTDPKNTEWQRDLSVSHNKVGDVLLAQGDGPAALNAYKDSRTIAERLASADPKNTEWQRDLSISHDRVGDVLLAQGDGPAALSAYQEGRTIRKRLASADPNNTQWQRDLSVSYDRVGDVLLAQGDGPAALSAYKESLTIREQLANTDPKNTEWLRDLSVSHNKVGDVLLAQGDGPAALSAYQDSRTIRERLANTDPKNTEWLRDLMVSHYKLSRTHEELGDLSNAITETEAALSILSPLTKLDPTNAVWANDARVLGDRLATLRAKRGQ